ncbi:hypothetical protein NDU88_007284 [Pleurodeles waltl]|uniref:Uncharacterized protein n=1 Tax=Pleurodeles waltl TaxID=8319 RepID=A0AAV7MFL8_PLEWA|nr:hypothetical protein NDU88_007284 [Pleurodeles waltl]
MPWDSTNASQHCYSVHGQESTCMSWDSTNASQHGYSSVHGQEAARCHGTVPTPLSTATLLRMDRRPLYVMGQYQRLSARLPFCAWTGGRCMSWDSTNVSQHGYSSVHGQEAARCHGTVPTPLSTATLCMDRRAPVCHGTVPTPLIRATLLCMDRRALYVIGQYQRPSARLLFCAWTGGRCMSSDSTNASQHGYSVHGQESTCMSWTVPTPLSTATLLCMDRRALYVMGQYQRLSARLLFCAWTGGR